MAIRSFQSVGGMSYVWPVLLAPHLDRIVNNEVLSNLYSSYALDSEDKNFTTLNTNNEQDLQSSHQLTGRCSVSATSKIVDVTFPTRSAFTELDLLLEVFFPRFFNCYELSISANRSLLRDKLHNLAGIMFDGMFPFHQDAKTVADILAVLFIKLGCVRELLKKDVHAAYAGDPAAASYAEIIRCYPSILAVLIQRVAHELYLMKALVYPRELCEMVHRITAIDIHPGAQIGEYFFIDHGVGTVIGETTVIGRWCRLYQNVTLGALHFEIDTGTGALKKGYKRHPTIGDNVVVGTGPIAVGDNTSIGANSWLQEDVPANTVVFIQEHPTQLKKPKRSPTPEQMASALKDGK